MTLTYKLTISCYFAKVFRSCLLIIYIYSRYWDKENTLHFSFLERISTFSFIIFVQHAEDSNKNKAALRPTSAWTDVKETGSTSACSTNRRTRLLAMLSSSKVENPYAERLNTFYSTLGAYKLVGNTWSRWDKSKNNCDGVLQGLEL